MQSLYIMQIMFYNQHTRARQNCITALNEYTESTKWKAYLEDLLMLWLNVIFKSQIFE